MRLRKPCEHGRYDPHGQLTLNTHCRGGEFLAADALIIERLAEAKERATEVLAERWGWTHPEDIEVARSNIDEILDALTVREGAE